MERAKDQAHNAFSPSIIPPSQFVTFFWDNNDINPESLKGLSLHCTNGIVIQSSRVVSNTLEPPSTDVSALAEPKQRVKKFHALPLEMSPYHQIKRKNTDSSTNVQLSMYKEEIKHSHMVDTLWVIARSQANKKNVEQQIPNWTGYNYLMYDNERDDLNKFGL